MRASFPDLTHREYLDALQLSLENSTLEDAVTRFEALRRGTRDREDWTSVPPLKRLMTGWYGPLRNAIALESDILQGHVQRGKGADAGANGRDYKGYGEVLLAYDDPGKLAIIVMAEALCECMRSGMGRNRHNVLGAIDEVGEEEAPSGGGTLSSSFTIAALKIGAAVEAELNVHLALLRAKEVKYASRVEQVDRLPGDGRRGLSGQRVLEKVLGGSDGSPGGERAGRISRVNMRAVTMLQQQAEAKRTDGDGEMAAADDDDGKAVRAKSEDRSKADRIAAIQWDPALRVKVGAALLRFLVENCFFYRDVDGQILPIQDDAVEQIFGTAPDGAPPDDEHSPPTPPKGPRKYVTKKKFQKRARELPPNVHPAFVYSRIRFSRVRTVGQVSVDRDIFEVAMDEKFESVAPHATRYLPMVVPPTRWAGPHDGAYVSLNTEAMRTGGCRMQEAALGKATLHLMFDGLDALGKVPWKINKEVLAAAIRCWDDGVVLGDIPSRVDLDVPPKPERLKVPPDLTPGSALYEEYGKKIHERWGKTMKFKKIVQKNMDLNSLRCSTLLKLNQAEKFQNMEEIYFPYNVDFRGRAYPIPPHLNHLGSDMSRGLLTLAEAKPLGDRGLHWLKVHLANLCGANKISFDDRVAFADEHMDDIRASVRDPGHENSWWMTCEEPFQVLATCREIVRALDSGDPASYRCSLPVHMDGSCNGLQHYAAIGLDRAGGRAVNLCAGDTPQDVYIGVMEEVVRRVHADAERPLPDGPSKEEVKRRTSARLVDGHIDRKVVKQTVMTSVYGVTYIGARNQIKERLEEKLAPTHDVDEIEGELHLASGYVAKLTMEVMGDLFQGARGTMDWLTACARLIVERGEPVAWISPLDLPIVQPYRQPRAYQVSTLWQTVVLLSTADDLPLNGQRQVSAFPPNFVHSLDSSHMLLTALEMERRGLTFTAVHDSYWTHPCDVDEMNVVLRECFFDLYNRPILEELKTTWELRYPDVELPPLPAKGELDLHEILDAPYFFQ